MAAGARMISEKADHSTLTEDDIVGARLHPPFEKYTNVELRWWLQCRQTRHAIAYLSTLNSVLMHM